MMLHLELLRFLQSIPPELVPATLWALAVCSVTSLFKWLVKVVGIMWLTDKSDAVTRLEMFRILFARRSFGKSVRSAPKIKKLNAK